MTEHSPTDTSDFDPSLQAAFKAARETPIDEQAVERVRSQAMKQDAAQSTKGNDDATWLRGFALPGAMVAVTLLVITLAWPGLSEHDAWAEVVNQVSSQPWMRLTLQKPPNSVLSPEQRQESFPNVIMWFDGKQEIAALDNPQGLYWFSLTSKEEVRFDAKSGRLSMRKVASYDEESVQAMVTVLSRFDVDMQSRDAAHIRLLNSREETLTLDGMNFVDFHFEFENSRATPRRQTMIVRVDDQTKQPVQLKILRSVADPKILPMVFAIDFPTSGPKDIFALGAPRDAPLVDMRSMGRFFPDRKPLQPADYQATSLTFMAGFEHRFVNEVRRFDMKDGVATVKVGDMLETSAMSEKVYFKDGTPTGRKPEISWWVKESDKLTYEARNMSGGNFPHNRCYQGYGGIDRYNSTHESVLEGLTESVELRGEKGSVWLDPTRDMIVRRQENVLDDGSISVRQYDDVVQDANGVWFATRWRSGRVAERGAPLGVKAGGVRTTVHYCEIQFQ